MSNHQQSPLGAASPLDSLHRPASGPGATAAEDADRREDVLFDTVITPARNLSPQGLALLMAAVLVASLTVGLAFTLKGAWPVSVFFGLDAVLIYWAFRVNFTRARAFEHLRLTRQALSILRADHRGRVEEIQIQPYWLRVEVTGRNEAEALCLRSHGEAHAVGSWLSPRERLALADALERALHTLRSTPHLSGAPAES